MKQETTRFSITTTAREREVLIKLIDDTLKSTVPAMSLAIREGNQLGMTNKELLRGALKLRDIGSQLGASWEQLDAWDDILDNYADEDEEETTDEEDSPDVRFECLLRQRIAELFHVIDITECDTSTFYTVKFSPPNNRGDGSFTMTFQRTSSGDLKLVDWLAE